MSFDCTTRFFIDADKVSRQAYYFDESLGFTCYPNQLPRQPLLYPNQLQLDQLQSNQLHLD